VSLKGGMGAGGGAGAGDIRAGGAVYEFRAEDKISPAADRLKQKLTGFGKWMQGMGQGLSGSLLFGGAAGMGMAFAQKVLGPAMDKAKDHLAEAVFKTKELAAASQRAADGYTRMGEAAAKLASGAMGEAAGIADPRKAAELLQNVANQMREKITAMSHLATAEFAESNRYGRGGFTRFIEKVTPEGDERRARAAGRFEAAKTALGKMAEHEAEVAERIRHLLSPEAMDTFKSPLTRVADQINDALDPAVQGMGQFERAVYELSKDGRLATLGTDLEVLRHQAIAADAALRPPGGSGLMGIFAAQMGALGPILEDVGRFNELKNAMRGAAGATSTRAADLRFGLGDKVMDKQLGLLGTIAGATTETAKGVQSMKDMYMMGP